MRRRSSGQGRFFEVLLYIYLAVMIAEPLLSNYVEHNNIVSRVLGPAIFLLVLPRAWRRIWDRQTLVMVAFIAVTLGEELYRWQLAITPFDSFRFYVAYVNAFIVYFLVRAICVSDATARHVFQIFLGSGVVFAVAVLARLTAIVDVTHVAGRITVWGMNQNELAYFFMVLALGLYTAFITEWRGSLVGRFHLIALMFGLLAALTYTGSRGGAIALGVGMLAATVLNLRTRALPRYVLLFPIVVGAMLFVLLSSEVMMSRLGATIYEGDTGARIDLARIGLDLFRERPLLGHGGGYVEYIGSIYARDRTAAHNTYLQILVSFGIVGFVPWAFLVRGSLVRAWRSRRTSQGATIVVVLIATLVYSLIGSMAYSKYLWILLAVAGNAATIAAPGQAPGLPGPGKSRPPAGGNSAVRRPVPQSLRWEDRAR